MAPRSLSWLLPLAFACMHPTPAKAPPPAQAAPTVMASLERTPCFGRCPTYKVVVFTDGRVQWEGFSNVGTKGPAEARLTEAQLAQLRDAFGSAKYFELEGNFSCRETTDMPSAKTFYSDGARSRSVDHYYGCDSTPGVKTLSALESRLDEVIQTDSRWIHPVQ